MKSFKRNNRVRVMFSLVVALCVLSLGDAAVAQDEVTTEEHPIDKSVGVCVDKDSSPNAIAACFTQGYSQWEKEVTTVYNQLLEKLDVAKKTALTASHTRWLQHRDSELQFIDTLYTGEDNPAHAPLRADQRMQVIRSRALVLQEYLQSLADLAEAAKESDGKDGDEEKTK